jgi:phosphate starvation-inducible protein PhoH
MKGEPFEAAYGPMLASITGKGDAYQTLKVMGKIEFHTSSYVRSLTFDNAIIIVDENQNMSWEELYTIATRVGRNSKIIFCGDGKQDDLHFKKNDVSGFKEFMEVTRQMSEFRCFRFTPDDIIRSSFVKQFIITCEKLGL